jgi:hypothetical protein
VIVTPKPGELIDGDPNYMLESQNADILLVDLDVGFWSKIGISIGDIAATPDLSNYAAKDRDNMFTALNAFPGVQFGSDTITDDITLTPLNFAVYADPTAVSPGPIAIQLPHATGSGQLYRPKKIDASDEVVTVNRYGTDLIGDSVSINFVEKDGGALLFDAAPGQWDNIGTSVDTGTGSAQTDQSWWYRPEINSDAQLAAWHTIGAQSFSRIDVMYPSGSRTYILQPGAKDPADPGQVAPNDYNAVTNNVHWVQRSSLSPLLVALLLASMFKRRHSS